METPNDPFEVRPSNPNSGAIPKTSGNADHWVSSSISNNLKAKISTAQSSKSKTQSIKKQHSKFNQTVKTQLKPQPPKSHFHVSHEITTNNSFAILEDLDLEDDSPHDFSQQQLNFETNIPYSQGSDFFDSISSTDVDDPPEVEPRSCNSVQEDNNNLISDTSKQVKLKQMDRVTIVECPQTPQKMTLPLTSNNPVSEN